MSIEKAKLIRKIRTLANRGVDGEKYNASEMLKKLMAKYNLSEEDIDDNPLVEMIVRKPKKGFESKLFWQIYYKLMNDYPEYTSSELYLIKKSKYKFKNVPLAFKIEFLESWSVYSHAFEKDMDQFYLAFLYRNSLLVDSNDSDKKPTEAELLLHKKASMMSMSLDEHRVRKMIEVH